MVQKNKTGNLETKGKQFLFALSNLRHDSCALLMLRDDDDDDDDLKV